MRLTWRRNKGNEPTTLSAYTLILHIRLHTSYKNYNEQKFEY